MSKNLYLTVFFGLIILLIGYYFSWITSDFWTSQIIGIASVLISGLFLIGFNHHNFPKKNNQSIRPIFLLPIIIGFSGLVIAGYFIPYLVVNALGWELTDGYRPNENDLPRFLILVVIWVFLEELYFRRILTQKIFNYKGFSKSLWISALVFSLAHWFTDIGLLMAFIAGLALAYIYLKTKSIWLCIFAHLFHNLTTFYITPKITERISEFNTTGKVVGIILVSFSFVIIMIFLIKYLTKNQTERRKPVGNNV